MPPGTLPFLERKLGFPGSSLHVKPLYQPTLYYQMCFSLSFPILYCVVTDSSGEQMGLTFTLR